ncbi:MAG: hypothetical protein SFZ03_12145 [Candidatus Melainabacteria bacterium]|nr:hypothetical protein [Candidatus Melainabacteria bacterium]
MSAPTPATAQQMDAHPGPLLSTEETVASRAASAQTLGQRYMMGVGAGAFSVAVRLLVSIVSLPVLVAGLGPEAFGLYVLLVTVVELCQTLELGMVQGLIKLLGMARGAPSATSSATSADGPEATHSPKDLLALTNGFFTAISLLLLVLGVLFSPILPQWLHCPPALLSVARWGVLLVTVESVLRLYASYSRGVLVSHCANHGSNLAEALYSAAVNLLAIALVTFGYGLLSILTVRLVLMVAYTVFLLRSARALEPDIRPLRGVLSWYTAPAHTRCSLLDLSVFASLNFVSHLLANRVDTFVIAVFLPLRLVSVFEIVFRMTGYVGLIGAKLSELQAGLFARLLAQNHQRACQQLFLRTSSLNNLVAGILLLYVGVFFPVLLRYFSAGTVHLPETLPLLAVAIPVAWSGLLQLPASAYLFNAGLHRYVMGVNMAGALVNLLLSVWWVQWLGLPGVALGTLLPQLAQHLIGLVGFACRRLNLSIRRYLLEVLGVALLPWALAAGVFLIGRFYLLPPDSAAPLQPASLPMLAAVGLLGGTIAFGLWFMTTASAFERRLLRQMLRQWKRTWLLSRPPQKANARGSALGIASVPQSSVGAACAVLVRESASSEGMP